MNGLELTLSQGQSPWICGEQPSFAVLLKNHGVAQDVPAELLGGALWLHLTDSASGASRSALEGDAQRDRVPDRRRAPPAPRLQALASGGERRYSLAVDSHFRQLPEPGRWRIEVSLEWDDVVVRSNALEVVVAPLSPRRLHSLYVVSADALRQVVHHGDGQAPGLVLMRQSAVRHPGDTAYRRILDGLSPQATVAMAIPTFADLHQLYAAALDRGVLRIGSDAEREIFRTDVAAASAQLQPLGWQTDHGSMEFVLLGGAPGAVELLIVTASLRGKSLRVDRVPLPLPAIPALWQVRRRVDTPAFQFVFAAGQALWRLDFSAAGPGRPVRLTASPGPACALALYPLQPLPADATATVPPGMAAFARGAPEDTLDAVFGPYAKDGQRVASVCRLHPDSGATLAEQSVHLPDDAVTPDWLLSQTHARPLRAALRVGDRVLGTDPSGRLHPLREGLAGVGRMELFASEAGYGLAWVSAGGAPRLSPVG